MWLRGLLYPWHPVTFPPGPLGAFPAEVNKPDGPDMHCDSCKPLNITYNPNEEDGAEFHCDPPIDLNNLPARIDPLAKCDLICDQMLQAEIECKTDAKWTGHPNRGFWCTKKQPSVEFWEGDPEEEVVGEASAWQSCRVSQAWSPAVQQGGEQ